jgi:hypothetical protein
MRGGGVRGGGGGGVCVCVCGGEGGELHRRCKIENRKPFMLHKSGIA